MSLRLFRWFPVAWALVACGSLACGSTPEPDPEVPTAEPEVNVTKPKKEKPKCETFKENCLATADTQAKIAGSESVLIPPVGWTFAQQSEYLVTQVDGSAAALALAGFDASGPAEAAAREAVYNKLLTALEIAPPERFKKKFVPAWDKGDVPGVQRSNTMKAGSMELKLLQAEQPAKRAGKPGFLLVIMTTDPAGKKIVGVAFSPEADEESVNKISAALETIGPGSY
jgi:hypothetical protein